MAKSSIALQSKSVDQLNKRERRRLKRCEKFGPSRLVLEIFERDGAMYERLSECNHEILARKCEGTRQVKLYRHCSDCLEVGNKIYENQSKSG